MSDTPEVTLSRPWTAGPWSAGASRSPFLNSDREIYDEDEEHVATTFAVADGELIALAPEMAEAILRWDDEPGTLHLDTEALLIDLAEKLRAIGGNHER